MDNSSVLPHGYVLHGEKQSYVIDRKLGQGSFGITYLAKFKTQVTGQMGSGNVWMQVCVKEFFMRDMNSRDEQTMSLRDATGNSLVMKYRRAFMREAHNLARMKHPGIVNVFEVIEANNTAYIVMEYIDGGSLDEYIAQRGRLPETEALACIEPVCDAMCYMHAQRMLHLDMKPKNVMRDEEGHLYLIDFGLSKQYTEDGKPETSTTIGMGTPGYAPIEQAEQRDESKDFRTSLDVYALGGTLYKMLTGQTPPTASEVNNAVLNGENLIQNELRQVGVSPQVAKVVSTAMWPGTKKRYQTVPELMGALGWTAKTYQMEARNAHEQASEAEPVVEETELTANEETELTTQPQPQPKPQPTPHPAPHPRKPLPKWLWGVVACAAVACGVLFTFSPQFMSPKRMYKIGNKYYNGTKGKSQDYTLAVEWYRKAAERGNVKAQCDLGVCYDLGYGVDENDETAVEWYRKSAEGGYARGQCNLGLCYELGTGVAQSYETAVEWYRKAAEQGYARGQRYLGYCYEYGTGVSQNQGTAVEWYRKAAEQGNAGGQFNLGHCYFFETGVEQSYETAVEWWLKSAEQDFCDAQWALGMCYEYGYGVEQSYETAVEWYRKAADQGDASGQYFLGSCYAQGNGVEQNYETAAEWYRKAAEQDEAGAQGALGACYEFGYGVEQNYEAAVEWYRKAAEQGNARAQCNLGACYDEGNGVSQDKETAVEWYRKAAEQGYAGAQCNLGWCYQNGIGVAKNKETAVEWFRKAADQGYASAQNCLGDCYYQGYGVLKNYETSVEWYRKAAEQGDAYALFSLGYSYEHGEGVEKNLSTAKEWYQKAAKQGFEEAISACKRLGVSYE